MILTLSIILAVMITIQIMKLLVLIIALILMIRSIFTLRIVGPRIFVSKFRNYCANQLDGALRKSTSFV